MLLAAVLAVSLLPGTVWAADSDFTIGDGVFTKHNGPDSVTAIKNHRRLLFA